MQPARSNFTSADVLLTRSRCCEVFCPRLLLRSGAIEHVQRRYRTAKIDHCLLVSSRLYAWHTKHYLGGTNRAVFSPIGNRWASTDTGHAYLPTEWCGKSGMLYISVQATTYYVLLIRKYRHTHVIELAPLRDPLTPPRPPLALPYWLVDSTPHVAQKSQTEGSLVLLLLLLLLYGQYSARTAQQLSCSYQCI